MLGKDIAMAALTRERQQPLHLRLWQNGPVIEAAVIETCNTVGVQVAGAALTAPQLLLEMKRLVTSGADERLEACRHAR